MESQRSLLAIGLAFVTFLLYQQWVIDTTPTPEQPVQTTEQFSNQIDGNNNLSAVAQDLPSSDSKIAEVTKKANQQLIKVTTDTLEVLIDTKGGDVVSSTLLKHNAEHLSEEKFVLLTQQPTTYIAQSGLIGRHGPDASSKGRPVYTASKNEWLLEGNELVVPLSFVTSDGLQVTKTFAFERNKHSIDISFEVTNTSANSLEVQPFYQLKQSIAGEESSMMMPTYRGGAYSTAEETYEKYDFEDMQDNSLNKNTLGGWVGMIQHYFVSAWVPNKESLNNLYSRVVGNNQAAIIGVKEPAIIVNSGETVSANATLFTGPKNQAELHEIHDTLDLTVDYGFLWFISQILFSALVAIYGFVGNWGIAIIIITILVKTLMYPLTKKQYESTAKMRALQPKMEQLKQRYGDDRQKFGQATMELYRKEKVNPMGGCLPLLLQMPIFLALYWVFLESVELRHAPFGLWITDLSAKDPYFILPVLFGASMFLMQKLTPTPSMDPMQQKMMLWMPVIFSVFFLWFPSGLVLYWLISNVISIAQMLIIYRAIDKKAAAKKS
ncbi:MAG: membrane protein insertase YidC [Gammaproteobacteria bacterium]|nr:membrane protein insertase YidC [Gammaproteobacteria bacterium]